MVKYNKDELIKALEIVIEYVSLNDQIVDYYCCGDKDTVRMATNDIFTKHDVPNKLTESEYLSYQTKFIDEINSRYDEIVRDGKQQQAEIGEVLKYLKSEKDLVSSEAPIVDDYEVEITDEELPF